METGNFCNAAAGNAGPKQGTITTPGVCPSIVTVGAVDDKRTADPSDDVVAEFSSRDRHGKSGKTGCGGSGVGVISLNTDRDYISGLRLYSLERAYATMSGTSVAAPVVAGIAALILEKHPDYKPDDIKKLLQKYARNIDGNIYAQGKGLVDLERILKV